MAAGAGGAAAAAAALIRLSAQELAERLGRVPVTEVMGATLEAEAAKLAEGVRERVSRAPGGEHSAPWVRTGALRDSVGHSAEGLRAAVGSTDPVAVFQETGTSRVPPRPFLAPEAAERGEGLAREVGRAVAAVLAGGDAGGTDADSR